MFLDNLSYSILRLCDEGDLSYARAAERCDVSERYFGKIARRQTAPTIATLEKLCMGLNVRPDELLLPESGKNLILVSRTVCLECKQGICEYPVCPVCSGALERVGQRYCSYCGQRLSWEKFFLRPMEYKKKKQGRKYS